MENEEMTLLGRPVRKLKKYPRGPKVHVRVTQEVMDISRLRDSSHCMIATAIKDAVPQAASISVDLATIRFSLPEKRLRYTYLTPRIAQEALVKFDQGETQPPFNFNLGGAHVTSMYRRVSVATPRSKRTTAEEAALEKAQSHLPNRMKPDHPELGPTVLVDRTNNATVPERVGGRPPPTTPFARRRAFGLRALTR